MNNKQAKIGYFNGAVSANEDLLETIKTSLNLSNINIYGFAIITDGSCKIKLNPDSTVMVMSFAGTYAVNVPTVFTGVGSVISELTFDSAVNIESMNYFYS